VIKLPLHKDYEISAPLKECRNIAFDNLVIIASKMDTIEDEKIAMSMSLIDAFDGEEEDISGNYMDISEKSISNLNISPIICKNDTEIDAVFKIPTSNPEIEWKHPWQNTQQAPISNFTKFSTKSYNALRMKNDINEVIRTESIPIAEVSLPVYNTLQYDSINHQLPLIPTIQITDDRLTSPPAYEYKPHYIPATSNNKEISQLGVSSTDIKILFELGDICRFFVPTPNTKLLEFSIGAKNVRFFCDDFQVLYAPFLKNLSPILQMERESIETNRCFFLHLGVAMQIHPFALQVFFRNFASQRLQNIPIDEFKHDLLGSLISYAGFVDAQSLCYVWPEEFNHSRICLISGSLSRPLFSCFFSQDGAAAVGGEENLRDIIIYCDGAHFTLLRPQTISPRSRGVPGFSVLSRLLFEAREAGLIVQVN
jgi:hypothetical protein